MRKLLFIASLFTATLIGCASSGSTAPISKPVSAAEAQSISHDAYLYAFAMTENYKTWRKQAVDQAAPEYIGGFNVFRHYSQAFTPENRDVVTPNNDTPYSWAWLDLRSEPMVVSVPAVPKDRYYVLQCVDLFTYNFAYIGVRSTGFDAGNYLIAGPGWKGAVPPGITGVFHAETEIVGILGRTQLNGPEDVDAVKAIQAGIKVTSLSKFAGTVTPPVPPPIEFPAFDKARAATHDYIAYLNFLLQFAEPPDPTEVALRRRFEKIGIAPGKPFDVAKVDPATIEAIDAGVAQAQAELKAKIETTTTSNGLFGSRETLGSDYLKRDVAAAMGLYGNSLEEAWYGGFVGDGGQLGFLHFPAGQLPPAKFFWSITLYTLPDRFLFDNPLNRYSIGDRTKGLKYDSDGGLTLYIGHDSPGGDKQSNWLPAPAGKYSLVARVYGPSEAAMTGNWKLPVMQPSK